MQCKGKLKLSHIKQVVG